MERYTYTAEEAKDLEGRVAQKGIKNGSTKNIELILCIRFGTPKEITEYVFSLVDRLTDGQVMDICNCLMLGVDVETIRSMCNAPEEIELLRKAYFEKQYAPERQEIYREVFEEFHLKWQESFEQLRKQTEILSGVLDFLQAQINKKDQELAQLKDGALSSHKVGGVDSKGQDSLVVREPLVAKREKRGTIARIISRMTMEPEDPQQYMLRLFSVLSEDQMEQVLDGYERGLSVRELRQYANKKYSAEKMANMKRFLLNRHDQIEPK